jgi:hypothetical protein
MRKDGLGVAIGVIADDTVLDQVIELLREKQHGPSRLFLLNALERSSLATARSVLEELANDLGLKKEVRAIQKRR